MPSRQCSREKPERRHQIFQECGTVEAAAVVPVKGAHEDDQLRIRHRGAKLAEDRGALVRADGAVRVDAYAARALKAHERALSQDTGSVANPLNDFIGGGQACTCCVPHHPLPVFFIIILESRRQSRHGSRDRSAARRLVRGAAANAPKTLCWSLDFWTCLAYFESPWRPVGCHPPRQS